MHCAGIPSGPVARISAGRGAFATWAFVGGSALRFLYGMPRFSEDLDFSLVRPGTDVRFEECMKKTKSVFERENYMVAIKARIEKTVQHAFIKFEGLLFELGLSPRRTETISIRIEFDTHPPDGAETETSIIRRHVLLAREDVKGRDVYDLIGYLSDRTWPPPNVTLLNHALQQTDWQEPPITMDNWKQQTVLRVKTFDWKRIAEDVRPFLERQQDLDLLNEQTVLKLLQSN